jgi:hypothetical protein
MAAIMISAPFLENGDWNGLHFEIFNIILLRLGIHTCVEL